jgi:hypothetical protein
MSNQENQNNLAFRGTLKPIIGIYPVTSIGVSFYHHSNIELFICRKDGITSKMFKEKPQITISENKVLKEIDISGLFTNGIVEALENNRLPAVILSTPCHEFTSDLIIELTNLAVELMKRNLLKIHMPLSRFCFPAVILASNGIIYDETIYNLKKSLKQNNIPDDIIERIVTKIVRASIMQGGYRDDNIYYPHKKGLLKIAVPKYDLFKPVVELLNAKNLIFSISTNPHKVEFEKALVNIATNTIAVAFALDKHKGIFSKINIGQAIAPSDPTHARFVREVQTAVFEVGKQLGAFNKSEDFERSWQARKEQILKHDSEHTSSSLYVFRNMIKEGDISTILPSAEYALIYPLKSFATYFQMPNEFDLFKELEDMILSNLAFLQKNHKKVTMDF